MHKGVQQWVPQDSPISAGAQRRATCPRRLVARGKATTEINPLDPPTRPSQRDPPHSIPGSILPLDVARPRRFLCHASRLLGACCGRLRQKSRDKSRSISRSQPALRWRRSLPKNGYVRSVRLHQVVNVTSGSTCFDLALIGGEDTTETQPETCLIMASIPIIERVLKAV